jgi:hypothetical protein
MAAPSTDRIVLAVGGLGLLLVVINQATAPAVEPALQRAAVLGGVLAVLLMLVGLLWRRIEPVPPERAVLQGREGLEIAAGLPDALARELAWGTTLLLTATPAVVVLLHWGEATLLRRGLLAEACFRPGPICRRALERHQVISLVDLRLYPGRSEFDALLSDLPSVVVQPLGSQGLLLLGGWSPRCFSRSDLVWIEGWSRRLTDEWAPALDAAAAAAAPAPTPAESGTG